MKWRKGGGWAITEQKQDDGRLHKVPLDDSRAHIVVECSCDPIEFNGVVCHRSFDGREAFEHGTRKPS